MTIYHCGPKCFHHGGDWPRRPRTYELCTCDEPRWSHDGLSSYFDGRLCVTCRNREGLDRFHASGHSDYTW